MPRHSFRGWLRYLVFSSLWVCSWLFYALYVPNSALALSAEAPAGWSPTGQTAVLSEALEVPTYEYSASGLVTGLGSLNGGSEQGFTWPTHGSQAAPWAYLCIVDVEAESPDAVGDLLLSWSAYVRYPATFDFGNTMNIYRDVDGYDNPLFYRWRGEVAGAAGTYSDGIRLSVSGPLGDECDFQHVRLVIGAYNDGSTNGWAAFYVAEGGDYSASLRGSGSGVWEVAQVVTAQFQEFYVREWDGTTYVDATAECQVSHVGGAYMAETLDEVNAIRDFLGLTPAEVSKVVLREPKGYIFENPISIETTGSFEETWTAGLPGLEGLPDEIQKEAQRWFKILRKVVQPLESLLWPVERFYHLLIYWSES